MSVKLTQGFYQAVIDGAFGLDTVFDNFDYEPTAGTEYIQVFHLPNDITPLSVNDSNETDGAFRIILYWPSGKGAIQAELKADEIMAAFGIGTQVCYGGQCATIRKTSKQRGVVEDGWFKLILTFGYKAIIAR